jgi:anti-sigma B factor antagonist
VQNQPGDFRLDVHREKDGAVLTVSGEVDVWTAPILVRQLDALFAEPVPGIAVDLGRVTFLDSTGIHALVTARARALARDVPFMLSSIALPVRLVLTAAGLGDLFDLESQKASSA